MEFRINLSLKLIISAFTRTRKQIKTINMGCAVVILVVVVWGGGLALQYCFLHYY